jgi:hypothetical protein
MGFEGTPTASCLQGALWTARFPKADGDDQIAEVWFELLPGEPSRLIVGSKKESERLRSHPK